MPINNIFNIKINSVSSNSAINFGNAIIKGNSVITKQVGGQQNIGDANFNAHAEKSMVSDPDLVDQVTKQANVGLG
jgi:hypothetical protein